MSSRASPSPTQNGSEGGDICAICLGVMNPKAGEALFTAECSHAFHFHCISSNVQLGNRVCPLCHAHWKQLPFPQSPRLRRRLLRFQPNSRVPDPATTSFADDEPLVSRPEPVAEGSGDEGSEKVAIETHVEFSAVQRSASLEDLSILIHLKAPATTAGSGSQSARTPADIVAVLDVSGSMAGTKLALLKQAMGFVVRNLGPSDRLSVVTFSDNAYRLFPLRRMSESGQDHALQALASLNVIAGTNIKEGLRMGAKVLEDRRHRNPVCSIMLLTDGRDTYTHNSQPDYLSFLPPSVAGGGSGGRVPVHAFGFGGDHDATLMHSISEASGGTFSFIESYSVIQDAFAQCIGGLLSVVVQDLNLGLECARPEVRIGSIRSGSYQNRIVDAGREGSVAVGDMYACETRDFLVSVNVPAEVDSSTPPAPVEEMHTVLLKVSCRYRDPFSRHTVQLGATEVKIQRPEGEVGKEQVMSAEVDRQKKRFGAADAMASARTLAECGDFTEAVSGLEAFRQNELEGQEHNDALYGLLVAEIGEMQERMRSREMYEGSGRAFVLSGMRSHQQQRAMARCSKPVATGAEQKSVFGSASGGLLQAYQTPLMEEMLKRSRAQQDNDQDAHPSSSSPQQSKEIENWFSST